LFCSFSSFGFFQIFLFDLFQISSFWFRTSFLLPVLFCPFSVLHCSLFPFWLLLD
jgi:hypothetical protein